METPEPKASKTDLSSLNDRQREAVISEQKRLLVLAGAGSGKTKTLLQKLVYLIEEKMTLRPLDFQVVVFFSGNFNCRLVAVFDLNSFTQVFPGYLCFMVASKFSNIL